MANPEELDLQVFKSVRVKAPNERAWKVFVDQMETWWPATHHIGNTPFEAIFIEPRVGGRWYERKAKGDLCDWVKSFAGSLPAASVSLGTSAPATTAPIGSPTWIRTKPATSRFASSLKRLALHSLN